ncbi:translocation protein TolB precursor, partial [Glaesserella parasuis]|nr:translocation protein TolB precursor [Glaesserella parasuis]
TVTIKRDEEVIAKIQERLEAAQNYYQQIIREYM